MNQNIKDFLPDFPFDGQPVTHHNWMTHLPEIDTLTLGELSLPGAHNAGMDKKADNYDVISGNWLTCQNDSFYYQLTNGARALDLRLGYERTRTGRDRFYFHHNGGRSFRELEALINDVKRFTQQNPDEFIILDFHQLGDGDQYFAYEQFSALLMRHLGSQIIPPRRIHMTLGDLKKASKTQRILVATGYFPSADYEYFAQRIQHEWSGKGLTSPEELNAHISKVMQYPPSNYMPWSLSATSYGALDGPRDISPQLNEWFHPINADWINKCSIVNADFFEESHLVANCRMANLIKANFKNM